MRYQPSVIKLKPQRIFKDKNSKVSLDNISNNDSWYIDKSYASVQKTKGWWYIQC